MPRAMLVVLLMALCAIVPATAAAQPIDGPEVLPPLFADEGGPGMAGPVTSVGDMLEGKSYVVRVRGIYSAFDRRLVLLRGSVSLGWHFCGDRVGARTQDAEFVWGIPEPSGVFCPSLPFRHLNLVLDEGAGFAHHSPVATLPRPDGLAPSNRYEYLVTRANGNGPLSVGILDSSISDNVGSLRVRVRPLDEDDCADGGWLDFGDAFVSESGCLAHVP